MDFMKHIKCIYDKNTLAQIDVGSVSLAKTVSPFSNTKIPVYRFYLQGQLIKKHNNLMVSYECMTCKRENLVCLNNITRKLNKENISSCNTCKNQTVTKVQQQADFMKLHASKIRNGESLVKNVQSQVQKLISKLEEDSNLFMSMDDEFKEQYFRRHMDSEEFQRICQKIISFQNDKFKWSDNFEYFPSVSVPNQSKFCPYFYDKERDVLEKPIYIKYRCDGCSSCFVNKELHIQKNKYKIYCQDCGFCNNTFKIRHIKNAQANMVCYQSKYELKFIQFCNNHGIIIDNGPRIQYCLNGKTLIYKVDFYIDSLKLLVELKDNHHWHKKQKESGKWQAKEDAANQYALNKKLEYYIVFPYNYVKFCKDVLQKHSLSNKI